MQADVGIRAFINVCLFTAPSFSGAASRASEFGIGELQDMGFTQMGFSADHSLGLQVSRGKECTITTPDRPRISRLRKSFAAALSNATGQDVSELFPQVVSLNGQSYIIQFDSNGGEAYVILKR